MQLTPQQVLLDDEAQVYAKLSTVLPAATPTTEQNGIVASAATPQYKRQVAAWARNVMTRRRRRALKNNAEPVSSTIEPSLRTANRLSQEQRQRALRDARLISIYTWLNPIYLIGIGVFVLLFCFLGLSGSDRISLMMLEGFVALFVMLLFGYGFMNRVFHRMRTITSKANAADINILLHGSGICQNLVGNKPFPYDLDTASLRRFLLGVLPNLRSADADLVSAQSHRIVDRCLQSSDPALALSVLEVLPRIGTQSALPHVEMLANGKGKLGGDILVREAATSCLILLNERLANLDTKTLLRASQPEASAKELLRAADTETVTAPEQLLRASKNNDS